MGKGALIFKGEEKPPLKKKTKKTKVKYGDISSRGVANNPTKDDDELDNEDGADADTDQKQSRMSLGGPLNAKSTPTPAASSSRSSEVVSSTPAPSIVPKEGKGLITTSGTVVMGHNGTLFTKQLRAGDALLVGQEMRVVTMCLSDISINLSSAFSQDCIQPTPYQFIARPRRNKVVAAPPPVDAANEGEGGSNHRELIYREKTEHGSYRFRKEILDQDVTRGDLLEMRTKKKSDKYC